MNMDATGLADILLVKAEYPATKEDLLKLAKGELDNFIQNLEMLPEKEYRDKNELQKQLTDQEERTGTGVPHKHKQYDFDRTRVSASEFAMYMKGIEFPATKKEIISRAKANNASEEVLQFMNMLPEKDYERVSEVEKEFGKIK